MFPRFSGVVFLLTAIVVFAGRRLALAGAPRSLIPRRRPHFPRVLVLRFRRLSVALPVWSLVVAVGLGIGSPTVALAFSVVVLARACGAKRRALRAQERDWQAAVPDLVELIRLALGSGCTIHLALLLIADHAGGAVSAMLVRTAAELRAGDSTSEVLMDFQNRAGASVRPLCAALLGSERYGLPLAATREALAVEARLARQREADMRSRRLPVLLIFPLVVCILPAFALLTVVPLLGGGLSSLSW